MLEPDLAPVSDLDPEAVAVVGADVPVPAGPGPARRGPWAELAWLAGGAAAVVVATAVLTGTDAVVRTAVAVAGLAAAFHGGQGLGERWRGPSFRLGTWLAALWMALVVGGAVLAPVLPVGEALDPSLTLETPSLLRPDLLSAHPLGTDRQGLDLLGGVLYGARVSLIVGFGAVIGSMLVGGLVGLLAGYLRKGTDAAASVLSDTLLAVPPLVLLLALVAILEPNAWNVALGLAVISVPAYVRLVRANTVVLGQRDFVLAARSLGAGHARILFREIVPNLALPVLSYSFVIVAVLIIAEASLSFLGLSVQRPYPTWGNLIAAGQTGFEKHPHLVFAPGVVLFLTVFSLNRLGEAARRWWDPRGSAI